MKRPWLSTQSGSDSDASDHVVCRLSPSETSSPSWRPRRSARSSTSRRGQAQAPTDVPVCTVVPESSGVPASGSAVTLNEAPALNNAPRLNLKVRLKPASSSAQAPTVLPTPWLLSSDDEGPSIVAGSSLAIAANGPVIVQSPGQQRAPRRIDLSVHNLTAYAGFHGSSAREQVNKLEKKGTDPDRVQKALEAACRCLRRCGPKLSQAVGQERVLAVIRWWHLHLKVQERCYLLQHMYDTGDYEKERTSLKTTWALCGHDVCKTAFCAILGISTKSLYRMTQGICGQQNRMPVVGLGRSRQAQTVHQFFLELYMSAAEPLPHEFRVVSTEAGQGGDSDVDAPTLDIDTEWCPERNVPAVVQGFLGDDVGLPRRFLTRSTLTNLYLLFTATFPATADDDADDSSSVPASSDDSSVDDSSVQLTHGKIPSFSTFARVWRATWSKYLQFRAESQHAECKTCFEARQRLSNPRTSMVDKIDFARQWKEHLRDQYFDRAIYWHCRFASRRKLGVLTIIIDSMDKAKFAWPQFPWHRVDKRLEGVHRPRLVFTAAIAHGFATFFFIADECVSHGASAFCEVLTRVVEKVHEMSRRSGVPVPAHLVVLTDNTVAQAKNSEVNCYIAYLVAQHKFQTGNMFHLIVGHTHEDIDQLFGMILILVLRRIKFQTKEELCMKLHEIMQPRIAAKGEELVVETIVNVRDFGTWLAPLRIDLYNAFGTRLGIEAPHAFTYKMRRDLTWSEQAMMPPTYAYSKGEECDIFCCVKTYMRDRRLQQHPLCVLPASRCRAAGMLASPTTMLPRLVFKEKFITQLRELAAILRSEVYALHRGADALDELADGPGVPAFPSAIWLETPAWDPRAPIVPSGNELFPHLPDSSWNLMVRFRRT